MPKVSLIIPVYNVEIYLTRCLESLIHQTHENIEIICVNDGSTDKSLDILKKYAQQDSRIIVLDQKNQGVSTARNEGMKKASGEYCSFIDSDDFVHLRFVEIMLKLLIENKADISECRILKHHNTPIKDSVISFDNLKYKTTNKPLWTMLSHKRFRVRYMVCPRIYKTSLIKNRPFIADIYFEDYPWTICLMSQNPKVVLIYERLYYYTYNPSSVTKSKFTVRKIHDYWQGLQFLYQYFSDNPKDLSFLKKRVVPNILKSQLQLIVYENNRLELDAAFARELSWCKENKLLSLWHNKWSRLYQYWKIMH